MEEGSKDKKTLFLGEILIKQGTLTWEKLEEALKLQKESGRILGEILVEKKFVSEEELFSALAVQFNKPYVNFKDVNLMKDAVKLVPKDISYKHRVIPLAVQGKKLLVAISNPMDVWAETELHKLVTGHDVFIVLATPQDIRSAQEKFYGPPAAVE